ncbi:MAG: glucosaminidase domain-containing protein [Selenomonas noxia]
MQKVIVLRGALAAALAVFILTSASGEARRVHDPDKATKIRTERTTNAPKNNDFRARIDALMKNANEINAPVREDDSPFSVPKTLSEYDTAIIGTPLASQEQCVSYLLSVNPHPAISISPRELVAYYYEEGAREGIRPDVAFAQALKETGFFRYGGTVTPDQNNYCGLGTTSTEIKGAYFATSQIGVRAHIQHLLAYASTRRPVRPVVDPRYNLVRNVYGTITLGNWQDLNGRWAVPGDSYGQSILSMFRAILRK